MVQSVDSTWSHRFPREIDLVDKLCEIQVCSVRVVSSESILPNETR